MKKSVKKAKKNPVIYFAIGAILIVAVVTFLSLRVKVEVTFEEDYMRVSAKDKESVIYYDEITHYSFYNLDDVGTLIEGEEGSVLIGTFENAEFGEYERYSYASTPDRVVVKTEEQTVVFNSTSEKKTRSLYMTIAKIKSKKK